MFDGAATRASVCPSCDVTVGDRSARWCGSCGAPLTAADPATDEPTADARPGPQRRTLLVAILAVVLVVVLVLAGDRWLGGDGRGTGVQDAAIDAPDEDALDDVRRRQPTPRPTPRPEPRCGARSPDCFLWTVEAEVAGGDSHIVAGEDVVAYQEVDGTLVGRDARDGSVLWTAPGVVSPDTWVLPVAGDLLVHRDEDGLVARDLLAGEARWRNEELAWLEVHESGVHDDVLLVAGHQPVSDHDEVLQGAMIGGFDVATGELLWHRSGTSTSQARGTGFGIALVLTDDGQVEAYGPAGDLRWELTPDLENTPEYVWAFGHVVSVSNASDDERLYQASDGTPLDIQAVPMNRDGRQTLLAETEPARPDDGWTQTGRYVLVADDGLVWEADVFEGEPGCFGGARLLADTVEVDACDGGTVRLDRTDGTIVSRSEPADVDDAAQNRMSRWRVGRLELIMSGGGPDDLLVLWDVERDTEFATFPSDTWPVLANAPGVWTPDLGGLLLLQGNGRLTAIDATVTDAGAESGSGAPDAGSSSG